MNSFVDIFVGVAKIVVSVVGSAVASTQIPKPKETLKDFGFIITNVLLPCLFLSQMVEAISLDMVLDSYILFVAAASAVCIGFVAAKILTQFVFPDKVKFTNISGVTFKLSLKKVSTRDLAHGPQVLTTNSNKANGSATHRLIIRVPSGVSADEVMDSLLIPTKKDLASVGYRTCVTIATMLQNTFVLPMSLIQSLVTKKGSGAVGTFAWIDLKQVTAFIFFFNIIITIAFWMVGPIVVRGGAKLTADRLRICDIIALHKASMKKVSRATQTVDEGKNFDVAPEPYSWRNAADSIVVITEGSSDAAILLQEEHHSSHSLDFAKIKSNVLPLVNAPLLSTFLGMILGLIPFTKEFLLHGHGSVLFDVCKLIGDGTVPASLFLLGCNLSTDFSIVAAKAVTFRHFSHGALLPSEDEEDEEWEEEEEEMCENGTGTSMSTNDKKPNANGNDSFTQVDEDFFKSFVKGQDPTLNALALQIAQRDEEKEKEEANDVKGKSKKKKPKKPATVGDARSIPSIGTLFGLGDIPKKFIVVLICTRLIILPAILFTAVYGLVQSKMVASIAEPCGNLLLLTLMVELFAPSAINTALLFNMEQFMIREYSKALLYQYTVAVITLMGWLLLTVQIVQGPSCSLGSLVGGTTTQAPAEMEVVRRFTSMGLSGLWGM